MANNTYFSFLYIEGGGTIAGVGIVMLLMVGSEAPFMQWSARLAGRFSLEQNHSWRNWRFGNSVFHL